MGRPKEPGIPLAEVLFTVLVLGLLAAVAIPPMVYSSDTREAQCRANIDLLNRRIDLYASRHNGWTPTDHREFEQMLAAEADLPSGGMPRCPYGKPYVYDPATGRIVPHKH